MTNALPCQQHTDAQDPPLFSRRTLVVCGCALHASDVQLRVLIRPKIYQRRGDEPELLKRAVCRLRTYPERRCREFLPTAPGS